MTRAALLADLRDARARLEQAIGPLDTAALGQPVLGDWRLQDLLTHVTAWEVDLLTNLGKVRRGLKPDKVVWHSAEIQDQNGRWLAEFKTRAPEAVLADFRGVHQQLLRQAEALSEAELSAPAGWLQGRSLETFFRQHVIEHEREHAEALAAARLKAGN